MLLRGLFICLATILSSLHWSYTLLLFLKQSPQNLDQLSTFNFPRCILFFSLQFLGISGLEIFYGKFFLAMLAKTVSWERKERRFVLACCFPSCHSSDFGHFECGQYTDTYSLLPVANTLTQYSTMPIHWYSTDIEQCCTVASILIQNTPQYFKWPHIVSTASKHSNSCVLRNFSEVN